MPEFMPLRDAVDALADRAVPPGFGDLRRRATRRGRRRIALAAVACAGVIVGSALAVTGLAGDRRATPGPTVPIQKLGTNGWVANEVYQGEDRGGDIYLVGPDEVAHRLEVAGPADADDACPAWSPDGTRLLFGRLIGGPSTPSPDAELVIVPVGRNGAAGTPTVIGLDGFEVLPDFDAHPCGTWSADGRYIALAGGGEVWAIDTQTRATRRLPDLHPLDLEWRPGTDELAIAGDLKSMRSDRAQSTPVTVYSVTSGEIRQLGSVEAGYVTWSPDGSTLAYTGAQPDGLWLVDADGRNQRTLLADMGKPANHGLGPVWSPRGDRILYQRRIGCCEASEVVLVSVADGATKVIDNPSVGNRSWLPYTVTWSPDGTTLLYTVWSSVGDGADEFNGLIAVPVDAPGNATMLTDLASVGGYHSHLWARIQMWGRQPEP